MGRPRKNGNFKKEIDIEDLLSTELVVEEVGHQHEDKESDVIAIDTLGMYGLKTYRYGYELHCRDKFDKDTAYEIKTPKGEPYIVSYKAGEFSPWRLSDRPFHGRLDTLFTTAAQLMVKKKIAEGNSIANLAKIIKESEDRIIKAITVGGSND
jgi:hypothetical protein